MTTSTTTPTTPDTQTYQVTPERLPALLAKLATMNKRAARLGVPGVVFTVSPLQSKLTIVDRTGFEVLAGSRPAGAPGQPGDHTEVTAWHDFEMTIAPVSLAGWTFVATLDHASEAGVILRTVPGQTVPVSYRTASNGCDHCHAKRNRIETFVVRHEDGTHKQIGRQCVRDFLGMDPTHAARMAEFAISLGEALDAEREFSGRRSTDYLPLAEYLAAVAVAMRLNGWRSRTVARDLGLPATATLCK